VFEKLVGLGPNATRMAVQRVHEGILVKFPSTKNPEIIPFVYGEQRALFETPLGTAFSVTPGHFPDQPVDPGSTAHQTEPQDPASPLVGGQKMFLGLSVQHEVQGMKNLSDVPQTPGF
jgi:hypothetical protein